MKRFLAAFALAAALVLAGPAAADEQDAQRTFCPDPWSADLDALRRCVAVLIERADRHEREIEALWRIAELRAWSHCHGTQAECDALRHRKP